MFITLKIDCPSNPDVDSNWHKEQVEEDIAKKTGRAPDGENAWIQWALVEALGDACDPKECDPLNMFAENELITSMTIELAFGSCKLTKM